MIEGKGHIVNLTAHNKMHYGAPKAAERDSKGDLVGEFGNMLKNALDNVNDKNVKADNLTIQAGINPDSVEIHDVMNAVAESELALNMTKAVTERVLRAYQEIINMR